MKRAFIILGSESAGSHFLRDVLREDCGLHDTEKTLPVNDCPKLPENLVNPIFRFSQPWGPNLIYVESFLRMAMTHYDVHLLVPMRDWECMIRSKVRMNHSPTVLDAEKEVAHAYVSIFSGIERTGVPYTVVTYESLGCYNYRKWLYKRLGLVGTPRAVWRDENEKHGRTPR